HLHELRDQAGVLARLVDHSAHIGAPTEAPRLVAEAMRAMRSGRRGPAALEVAIDTWGASALVTPHAPLPSVDPPLDGDAILAAAKRLGAAKNPMIICGGGALDASPEVTELSAMLQAPVLGYRRGRGVLDSRDPLSVTLPLAHELWAKTDAVLAVGTRMFMQQNPVFGAGPWGFDDDIAVIRVDSDPDEPARLRAPAVALVGDAAPVLRALIDALPAHNAKRPSGRGDMTLRQAGWSARLSRTLAPQVAFLEAIRAELPEDGIYVDEVTQVGFTARLAFPVYKSRTFLSPGYQDNLGW